MGNFTYIRPPSRICVSQFVQEGSNEIRETVDWCHSKFSERVFLFRSYHVKCYVWGDICLVKPFFDVPAAWLANEVRPE